MKNNPILIIFLSFAIFFSSLHSVKAQTAPQQSLRVSPIINDLQLTPGKPTIFNVTVENISQNPVGIHAEITGNDILGETTIDKQKPSALVGWTILSSTDLLIPAGQKKVMTVTINTPKNTKKKGYYEAFFLTPILNHQQSISSPIILSRIGILVLGTVGKLDYNDLANKVSVTDITPSGKIVNAFPQTISFTVANNYFSHFDAKPFITIKPFFAKSQTILLSDKHILPGSARMWQYTPTVPKNRIFYRIHLAISIGDGKQIVVNTWFVVLPYQQILLVVLGLVMLWYGIIKRNRLKKFITILLQG